jgi:hypothetical protein
MKTFKFTLFNYEFKFSFIKPLANKFLQAYIGKYEFCSEKGYEIVFSIYHLFYMNIQCHDVAPSKDTYLDTVVRGAFRSQHNALFLDLDLYDFTYPPQESPCLAASAGRG